MNLVEKLSLQTVTFCLIFGSGTAALASDERLPVLAPASPGPTEETLREEDLPEENSIEENSIEEDLPEEMPTEEMPTLERELPTSTPGTSERIQLNLPDLINVVIQGNRELKNAVLERVVQQQTLVQAESAFSPQLTPSLSIRADRTLSNSDSSASNNNFPGGDGGDRTDFSEDLEVTSTLATPLGTQIEVSLAPTDEFSRVNLTVNQPLLRGAGQAVNRAPVQQARIVDDNNVLALRQQVIDTITNSVTQYTTLVQAQEAVVIQAQALERRRQQSEIVTALVEAGRQARVDLVNSARSIAEAELSLQARQNELAQANTDLLNLIGSEATYQFVVPDNVIAQLFEQAVRRADGFQQDRLIEMAYQLRPDYQQAIASLEIEDLSLLLARDNRRWNLDWQNTARIGDDTTQLSTGLELSRTFGNESLRTAVTRSQTSLLQQQNTIDQLTETIRNQVTDRLRDVGSELAQVEAAQRATEAAQLQLQVTQEKFKLGRDNTTLFDITQQEENLVTAQNAELQARISVLNSIAELEQAVGITIDTWQPLVDFGPVLAEEES